MAEWKENTNKQRPYKEITRQCSNFEEGTLSFFCQTH